tara:strand:+ start:183 stop:500 length:318 start_codon:yes stop_codon:yes gene_type:complete
MSKLDSIRDQINIRHAVKEAGYKYGPGKVSEVGRIRQEKIYTSSGRADQVPNIISSKAPKKPGPGKPVSEFAVGRSQAKGMGAGLLKDIKRKMMKHLPGKLKKTY